MDFRRIEVRRVVKHSETVESADDIRAILESLKRHNLSCTMVTPMLPGKSESCIVLGITGDRARIFCRGQRVTFEVDFTSIGSIEVVSNCDFVAVDKDSGGRWASLF